VTIAAFKAANNKTNVVSRHYPLQRDNEGSYTLQIERYKLRGDVRSKGGIDREENSKREDLQEKKQEVHLREKKHADATGFTFCKGMETAYLCRKFKLP